jgi:peptide/nickel transport system permease protein
MTFLLRRLGGALVQLIAVSALAFALMELAPGDYLEDMRVNPQIPAATVARWRAEFGLDQPAIVRYGRWVRSVASGEFGVSMAYGIPVSELIAGRLGRTVALSLLALGLTWLLALPCGVWCAAYRGGWLDRLLGGGATVALALPELLVGLLVLQGALWAGWGPVSGRIGPAVAVLAAVSFPSVFRHTRSSVGQSLRLPFVDHLRAAGLSETRILFRHVLPASLNPLVSLLSLSLAGITSASLVVEVTLSWPGMGQLLLEAILARDVAVVLAAVMVAATLLQVANLVGDGLLYLADPRIRRRPA